MSQMLNDKDPNDPATTSLAWDEMVGSWAMIDSLLGGTKTMRQSGTVFLPQHTEESEGNYAERLEINILFNALELTLDHFVGKPFSDSVRLNSDVPEVMIDDMVNIDLQGNDLSVFCREWFREALAKGFAHVMVDMPQMNEEARVNRTREDDLQEGRRPFWLLIKPENMIFAEAELVVDPTTGEMREWFSHVRIRENIIVRTGFAEEVVERIRVLEPGTFQVWEKIKPKDRRRKEEWRVVEQGETGISFIPIVTYYTNRTGFMVSKPPLEDLAYLNIRHWQSTSDQINILTVVRFPMLAVAGATDQSGATMRIGPRQLLTTKDANGRFYYVEHTGKSIESGWKELALLEDQMEAYGATLITTNKGNPETAEGRVIDNKEATSALQDMVIRFIDAVNNAMKIHATWLGLESGGTVTITTDFGTDDVDAELADLLKALRKDRDISRKAVIKEAKKLGALSDDYDPDTDFEQLVLEDKELKPLQPQIPGTFDPSAEGEDRETPDAGGDDTATPRAEDD